MKKIYIILSIAFIVLIYLFYPRNLNLAIYVSPYENGSKLIYRGKKINFKYKLPYDNLTVLNIKYSPVKLYKTNKINPNKERIMEKEEDYYDLELSGKVSLSGRRYFYKVNSKNILKGSGKDLLVGYDNISSFKDKKGNLSLFLIYEKPVTKMRVCITNTSFSSMYQNSISIRIPRGGEIYSLKDNLTVSVRSGELCKISYSQGSINLNNKSETTVFKNRIYIKGENIEILSIKRGYPSFNPVYNGILEINIKNQGLLIINEVSIEDYLKKVVPSEMPASSDIEALKCQSVAARTYAISDALSSRFANLGFFVDDSTKSQVYNNYKANKNTDLAVESTKGEIMTYNEKPIDAKYYSTSTGISANYKDIWFYKDFTSENKPYLKVNNYCSSPLPQNEGEWLAFYKNKDIKSPDDKSPYYRWEIYIDKTSLINSLNKTIPKIISSKGEYVIGKFKPIKDIKNIKISSRGAGGNAKEITISFDYGDIVLRSDSVIRYIFKFGEDYTNTEVYLNKNNKSKVSSIPSSFFSAEADKDSFVFYGGGFGHGVGMSQYGAMKLADSGYLYKDILALYYNDINLSKIY